MNELTWPVYPGEGWPGTRASLHMWTQIVGKVRLALSPPQNHYWHSTLYLAPRGLTTSPMPYRDELVQIDFDFIDHCLNIQTSWGASAVVALEPKSVADFHAEVTAALRRLGIEARIWSTPVEVADPIPFEEDRVHVEYDPAAAHAFWRVLIQVNRVFTRFRGRFLGKSSPVHFFWGGFDLAVSRFSGRRGPMWSGPVLNVNQHVMHESYSHEVSSAGFWPRDTAETSLFYSYAVPEPPGFSAADVQPPGAVYSKDMGEFILPYEIVRASGRPDAALDAFLQSTYEPAASLGSWDRAVLEQRPACGCDFDRPARGGRRLRTTERPTGATG
jgi:hypothetical protein